MSTSNRPKWYMVAAILAFVWNIMGVMAYLAQAFMPPEALESMTESQRTLHESTPTWVTAAFATAVWGGALGTLLLILKKSLAHLILLISLIGIVVQQAWIFFVSNSFEVYGPGQSVMPIMVLIIGVWLVWFSRKAKAEGWTS